MPEVSHEYPFNVPTANDACEALKQSLREWAAQAAPAELKALNLLEQARPQPHWTPSPKFASIKQESATCTPHCVHFQFPPARSRARPRFQRVEKLEPLRIRDSVRKTLSQVYTGEMLSEDDGSPFPVVVKVYQNSINHWVGHLDPKRRFCTREEEWNRILCAYKNEYWAYERMQPLQGIVVPHVYGFFKVVLPSQEPAIVMLMEYIEPNLPPALTDSIPIATSDSLGALALGTVAATHAVANCGVFHPDLHSRNLVWPGQTVTVAAGVGIPGLGKMLEAPLPVLIDFGDVSPFTRSKSRSSMITKAISAVFEHQVYEDVARLWWKEAFTDPSFIRQEFDMSVARADSFAEMCPKAGSETWTGVVARPVL